MYLAEIHGKLSRQVENKEDILTSNVFSFFKYTPRDVFLYPFLQQLNLHITPQDATQAEFIFWPNYQDNTEPDLVILVGEYYLLVEAKYFSGFGQETSTIEHQLVREIEGSKMEASSLGKTFMILAITAHYIFTSEIFSQLSDTLRSEMLWTNWHEVALLLDQILEQHPPISNETRLFAEDLYILLVKKGLRKYAGLRLLEALPHLEPHPGPLFIDASTTTYRGVFIGFASALGDIETITPIDGSIYYHSHTASKTNRLFESLESSVEKLEPHPLTIFYGGHHGEE